MRFKDQLHRYIDLTENPKRIISLVPSQTELLVELGLRDKIVGVTKFCVHPLDLRETVTVVGGTKKVNLDKISLLKPDLIICNKEENTLEMVTALEKIAPVWISDIFSAEDNLEMIRNLGDIFEVSETALSIIEDIKFEMRSFSEFMAGRPVRKVHYVIWKNPYMVAGRNTFINQLLEFNKFENVIFEEDSRYPEVEVSEFLKADLVLLSSEPYPFKDDDILSLKKEIPNEVILVDGEYFSWYGSRLKDAFIYFRSLHS